MAQENDWSSVGSLVDGASDDWSSVGSPVDAKQKKQNKGILSDLGTDLKRGVQQLPGAVAGLVDIPVAAVTGNPLVTQLADAAGEATGFQPGKWAKEAESEYSPKRQAGKLAIDEAWNNGKAVDIAASYLNNPENTLGAIIESVPSMLAGGLAGRAALGIGAKAVSSAAGGVGPQIPGMIARTVGEKMAPAVAAGMGEGGVMAGQAMQNSLEAGVDPREAAAYAAGTGILGGAIGAAGGSIAQRMGIVDPDIAMVGGKLIGNTPEATGKFAAAKALGKRVVGGGIAEGALEELPQSVMEQGLSNLAQDKPITEGMARAGVEGTLAGMGMGAAFNVLPGAKYAETQGQPRVAPQTPPSITITTDPAPLQQRIDQLLSAGTAPLDAAGRTQYEKDIADALNETVGFGIGHDANQNEIQVPYTMGEYLDSQVESAELARERAAAATKKTAVSSGPDIPVVGPLSAVAKFAVDTGAAATAPAAAGAAATAGNPLTGGLAASGTGSTEPAGGMQAGNGTLGGTQAGITTTPAGETTANGGGTITGNGTAAEPPVSPAAPKKVRPVSEWSPEEIQARLDRGNLSPESDKALRDELARRAPATKKNEEPAAEESDTGMTIGRSPNSAAKVTIKGGVIYLDGYAAADYETGDDVTVPAGATPQQIEDALRKSGNLSGKTKLYGKKTATGTGSTTSAGGGTIAEPPTGGSTTAPGTPPSPEAESPTGGETTAAGGTTTGGSPTTEPSDEEGSTTATGKTTPEAEPPAGGDTTTAGETAGGSPTTGGTIAEPAPKQEEPAGAGAMTAEKETGETTNGKQETEQATGRGGEVATEEVGSAGRLREDEGKHDRRKGNFGPWSAEELADQQDVEDNFADTIDRLFTLDAPPAGVLTFTGSPTAMSSFIAGSTNNARTEGAQSSETFDVRDGVGVEMDHSSVVFALGDKFYAVDHKTTNGEDIQTLRQVSVLNIEPHRPLADNGALLDAMGITEAYIAAEEVAATGVSFNRATADKMLAERDAKLGVRIPGIERAALSEGFSVTQDSIDGSLVTDDNIGFTATLNGQSIEITTEEIGDDTRIYGVAPLSVLVKDKNGSEETVFGYVVEDGSYVVTDLLDAIDRAHAYLVSNAGVVAEPVAKPAGETTGTGGGTIGEGETGEKAQKKPRKPKEPVDPNAKVTVAEAKKLWAQALEDMGEEDAAKHAGGNYHTLLDTTHIVSEDGGWAYHFKRNESGKPEAHSGFITSAAEAEYAAINAKTADAVMGRMIEEGDAPGIAAMVYRDIREATAEDNPIVFPDDRIIRLPVLKGERGKVEDVLKKLKFRITDRLAETDDAERIVVSAIHHPDAGTITDTGFMLGGRKQSPPTTPPKDADDKAIDKYLADLHPSNFTDKDSNEEQNFGTMMFKEGAFFHLKYPLDFITNYVIGSDPQFRRDAWGMKPRDILLMAMRSEREGVRELLEKGAEMYVERLTLLQNTLHPAKTVEEAAAAMRSQYIAEDGSETTKEGAALGRVLNINNRLPIFIGELQSRFEDTQDTTDQTNRYVKKDPDVPPRLENIIRTGMKDRRNGKSVNENDFKETFGFREVEFGNWVNQIERQENLNLAYDSLYDMADMLGLAPNVIGLNKILGLGIGSRGRGGKAAAHYEPGNKVINLTKTKGNGTVGHEWGHAFDYLISEVAGESGKGTVSGAIEDIKDALMSRINVGEVEALLRSELRQAADTTNRNKPPKDAVFEFVKGTRYGDGPVYFRTKDTTEFYRNAKKMDPQGKDPYWSKKVELYARAYETFLFDTAKGGTPYLVGPSRAVGYMSPRNGYGGTPYPTNKNGEREYITKLFADLYEQIDKDTLKLKRHKVDARLIEIEGLGFAVVDQFGRNVEHLDDDGDLIGNGSYTLRFNIKKKEEAEEMLARANTLEVTLDPVSAQVGKANDEILKVLGRVDEIMEEMGIIKWPEVKNNSMAESMFYHLRQGWWPKDNKDLKEYAAKAYRVDVKEVERLKLKQAQEDFEAALARYASQKITDMTHGGANSETIYQYLVELYNKQPNLNERTSVSFANQAYSTPLPIAYVAGLLGRVKSTDTVFDPTGGNGLLLINANPKKAVAVELDPARANNMRLMQIGRVIDGDATTKIDEEIRDQEAEVVLANPPFGAMADAVPVPSWNGTDYWMEKIDHLIAAKALRAMADDGRAVIILGAHKKEGVTTKPDRVFLNWLHGNYNVTDHFEVDGGLYSRMGAEWPIRVLVVSGRNHTEKVFVPKDIERIYNHDQLWSRHVQAIQNSEAVVVGAGKQPVDAGGANSKPGGVPAGDQGETTSAGGEGGTATGGTTGADDDGRPDQGGNTGGAGGNTSGPGGRGGNGKAGRSGSGAPGPTSGGGGGGGGAAGTDTGGLDGLTDSEIEALLKEGLGLKTGTENEGEDRAPKQPRVKRPAGETTGAPRKPGTGRAKKGGILSGIPGMSGLIDQLDALIRVDDDTGNVEARSAGAQGGTLGAPSYAQLGEQFNEDTYGRIRPVLNQIWEAVGKAVNNLSEHIKTFAQGLGEIYGKNILPYAMTFVKEKQLQKKAIPNKKKPIIPEMVESASQAIYRARSAGDSSGIYGPRNQAREVQKALESVEAEYGDIDSFVRDELGYASNEEMWKGRPDQEGQGKGLGGYQVDAIALAIAAAKDNAGFIIGDDTGVGKGRTAAAMIAWAKKNGKVPIFFTLNPELYSAMYDDLNDINMGGVKIATTNNTSHDIVDRDGKAIYSFKQNANKAVVRNLLNTGKLDGADALFTTYAQVNIEGDRRKALRKLVSEGKAVIIMDEAHNAAGESGTNEFFMQLLTGEGLFGEDSDGPISPPDDWLPPATVYLSATFAKRPSNMPVYVRTSLRHAANSPSDLAAMFGKSSAVLQEISSAMLVESGSMIRRERSYAGVEFGFKVDEANAPRDARVVNKVTEVLRSVVRADRQFAAWVKTQEGEDVIRTLVPPGWVAGHAGSAADVAMNKNLFTSVVHNYIGQLLLATKVDTAVEEAIASIERGEKVVLTLQNTMEAMLEDYVSNAGVMNGDEMPGFGWQSVLSRGLMSARRVTFSSPNKSAKAKKSAADSVRVVVPENLIPPLIRTEFEKAGKLIAAFQSDLPASPIDALRARLSEYRLVETKDENGNVISTKAVKTKDDKIGRPMVATEITGRNRTVDYSGPVPKLSSRSDPDKIEIIQGFQKGAIDLVILNSSGSTGISLHAAEWAKDQRPRRMIILQPNPDIAVFKQTIGRIHRTGQVEWPHFTVLATGIPAERRQLAVLKKKMSVLFSNTSAGKGATDIEAVNFINQYGDIIVAKYLEDNIDAAAFIGIKMPETPEGSDISLTASGRAALLSVDEQRDFFDTVEEQFTQEIESRNQAGTNALARRSLDLRAIPLEEDVLEPGLDESNPFTRSAFIGKYSIAIIGDIPNPEGVRNAVASALDGRSSAEVVDAAAAKMATVFDESLNQLLLTMKDLDSELSDPEKLTPSELQALTERKANLQKMIDDFGLQRERTIYKLKRNFAIGSGYGSFRSGDVESPAVVVGISIDKPRGKKSNPFSESNVRIHFMRALPNSRLTVPLSSLTAGVHIEADPTTHRSNIESQQYFDGGYKKTVDEWFAMRDITGGRQNRYILTGNVLRGRANIQGGDIIQFTMEDGKLKDGGGILMGPTWKPDVSARDSVTLRYPQAAVDLVMNILHRKSAQRYDSMGYEDDKKRMDDAKARMKHEVEITDEMVNAAGSNNLVYGPGKGWFLDFSRYSGEMTLFVSTDYAKFVKSKALGELVGTLSKNRKSKYYESKSFKDPLVAAKVIELASRYSPVQAPIALEAPANELLQKHFAAMSAKKAGEAAPAADDEQGDAVAGNIADVKGISERDRTIYGMAVEGKSASEVLTEIANNSEVPFYREVAKRLLAAGVSPTITVGDGKGWKFFAGDGRKYAAAYNPKSNTVSLFRPSSAERNMIHELVHAATISALEKNGLSASQLKALFNHVKSTGKLDGMYGMTDIDEFIAEVFSNPKFQDALSQIPAPKVGPEAKNAWQWLVSVLRGILGLSKVHENALEQALRLGKDIIAGPPAGPSGGGTRFAERKSVNQTNTPEFKKWFGGSKVVDANGKPLVVYHGTRADITEFDGKMNGANYQDDAGFFFTSKPKNASNYAGKTDGSNVIPVYLSISNPKVFTTKEDAAQHWYARLSLTASDQAKSYGHDGIIVIGRGGEKMVIAFKPTQIKSAIGNNGQFDPTNPDIRYNVASTFDGPVASKMDNVIYSLQDKHIDMRRVVQSIEGASGDIADEINPYLQEELFHGRTSKGVKDFLDLELRPLLKAMEAEKVDMGDFEEYLWNRHAEERNIQIAKINDDMPDGGSGIDTADAQAYLENLSPENRAKYERLAARVDEINRVSREILFDTDLENRETINKWEETYENYVPLHREDVDTGTVGTGMGYSVRGSSTKRAMGSGKAVVDIIANIAMQRERNIVRGEKNRVSNALLGLAVENPNPDFWKVDKAPTERVVAKTTVYVVTNADGSKTETTDYDEAEELALAAGTEDIETKRADRVTTRVEPGFKNKDNVVVTRINGKDHYIIFNERDDRAKRMAQAVKNLDVDGLGHVLSVVGKATRYLASVNTQYNPVFGVINLVRDVQGALINLASTPLAGEQKRVLGYTKDALVGIYRDIRAHRRGERPSSNWANLFEEFQKEGGQTGYRDSYANAEQRSEAIKGEIEQFAEGKAKQLTRGIFGWLSDYNETMENAVRLASYKVAREKGMSKQQAASLARNLTVNFNRKGQMAQQVGSLYAFFNASVQGSARLAATLFEQGDGNIKNTRLSKLGKKVVAGGIMLGAMQALLLAAAGYDDDEPPEFVKERNLILPIGDGKYLSLPMPLGFHVLPGIGRIAMETVLSGGKDPQKAAIALLSLVTEAFNPVGSSGLTLQTITPTVVDPFAALAENKDFTGREIFRENFNSLNPTTGNSRAKDVASPWARAISSALNFITGGSEYRPGAASPSPDAIDYLIGQATGGVGRELGKLSQTVTSAVTGEELPMHKIPLVGRFAGDAESKSSQSQKFYSALREINMAEAEYKGIVNNGQQWEAAQFLAEHPETRLMLIANGAESAVRRLREQKKVMVDRGADPEQVRAVEEKISSTMKRLNDTYERQTK